MCLPWCYVCQPLRTLTGQRTRERPSTTAPSQLVGNQETSRCWTYSSTGEQYSVRIYKISLWYIQLSSFLLVESSIPSSYMQIPNPALFHTHISFSVLRVKSLLCNQFIKQSVTKPRKYKYLSHQQLELSENS